MKSKTLRTIKPKGYPIPKSMKKGRSVKNLARKHIKMQGTKELFA